MSLVLYKTDGSPPARAVLMTLDILGLKPKMVEVTPLAGDTQKPEFIAKNPAHTIPFLEDKDFGLSDSHAIITYLVSKYGGAKKEELYSSDFVIRATIDQRMYFDASILFPRLRSIIVSILIDKTPGPTPKQVEEVKEAYGILEIYLEKKTFLAGNNMTLADISVVSTVSSLDGVVPITDKFPKLSAWFEKMKATDFYKNANEAGAKKLTGILTQAIQSNSS